MVTFKDRLLSPKVAAAMMSPIGILAAGIGAAVVVASGAPLVLAPVAAVGVWAAKVGLAVPKKEKKVKIDYQSVTPPWRNYVVEVLTAQRRFEAISEPRSSTVADRLAHIGERVDEVVERAYLIAQEGQRLSLARKMIDSRAVHAQLAASPSENVREALESQLSTGERLDTTIRSTMDRLVVIDARLDELVARAIELSATGDVSGLTPVEKDLTNLVDELEAVRLAAVEVSHQLG